MLSATNRSSRSRPIRWIPKSPRRARAFSPRCWWKKARPCRSTPSSAGFRTETERRPLSPHPHKQPRLRHSLYSSPRPLRRRLRHHLPLPKLPRRQKPQRRRRRASACSRRWFGKWRAKTISTSARFAAPAPAAALPDTMSRPISLDAHPRLPRQRRPPLNRLLSRGHLNPQRLNPQPRKHRRLRKRSRPGPHPSMFRLHRNRLRKLANRANPLRCPAQPRRIESNP